MQKIAIITVGKLKEKWWQEAQLEYVKRLKPIFKLEIVEVPPEPTSNTVSASASMKAEGKRILKRLSDDAFVIALERSGEEFDSPKLAAKLAEIGSRGDALTLVIGGSEGIDSAVLSRVDLKWSLSRLTFIHEMARVILLEQLYRSHCIMSGKKYHK
jgi:23S rRNA (pseudouridine1915-N3)-methyltransferase